MEIYNYIVLSRRTHPDIISYVEENRIPYKEGCFVAVNISESSPHWPQLQKMLARYCEPFQSTTEFTKDELKNAQWLRVWSKRRCGYPQPENSFISKGTTYSHENLCAECGRGAVQVAPFRMKKPPKWNKHHFAELNWIGDELFLSEKAKKAMDINSISGVSFEKVLNSKGSETLEDVFQLVVPSILKPGLCEEETQFAKISVCPLCGEKKYIHSGRGMVVYRREAFENAPDVAKTWEIFGAMHYAVRFIFIRQNVYQTLTANKLDRDLVFAPVRLI